MRVRRYFKGTSKTWQSSKAVVTASIEYALLRNQASLLEAVLLSAGILRGCSLDMFITCCNQKLYACSVCTWKTLVCLCYICPGVLIFLLLLEFSNMRVASGFLVLISFCCQTTCSKVSVLTDTDFSLLFLMQFFHMIYVNFSPFCHNPWALFLCLLAVVDVSPV